MNRYKIHEPRTEPTEEYSCNWEWSVSDLRRGDFLSVEWSKVSCGIPNGYQCYVLKVDESSIDVIVEDQPASSTGWAYETIPKDKFSERFWATNIHRRNTDLDKILALFRERGTEIYSSPRKATMLFGLPFTGVTFP